MLEQNITDGKQGNSNHAISDEELDAMRRYEPQAQNQASYDIGRYKNLTQLLADELTRDNNSLLIIANITRPKDFNDRGYGNLWYDRFNGLSALSSGRQSRRGIDRGFLSL